MRGRRILNSAAWLGLVLAIFMPATSYALTPKQKRIYDSGINYFNVESGCVSAAGGSCVCSSFTGSNNAEIAFNFFVSKGLTAAQAAGIIGNLQVESGPDIDPAAVSPSGYRGIAQWDAVIRWPRLVAWAQDNNRDELDLATQLEYLFEEASQRGNIDGIHAYDDVEHTTWYWGRFFEVAVIEGNKSKEPLTNVQGLDKRTKYAQVAFAAFANNATGTGACQGVGGVDRFPLNVTQAIIEAGSSNESGQATWCYLSEVNCHHDYNAADIHVVEGTEVVAAKAGEVVSTTDAIGGVGSRVTIRGDDGQFIYYYAHMAYGSLLVNEGDQVAVGQPIGVVGSSTQAVGTAPHLHFDMLPADEFPSRPSCSGAECSSYPFIDVQPILKEVYESQVTN